MKNRVVVRSKDVTDRPLIDTEEAKSVEIYDSSNKLIAIMHRVLSDNYWGVSTIKDADWLQVCTQMGVIGRRDIESVDDDFFKGD